MHVQINYYCHVYRFDLLCISISYLQTTCLYSFLILFLLCLKKLSPDVGIFSSVCTTDFISMLKFNLIQTSFSINEEKCFISFLKIFLHLHKTFFLFNSFWQNVTWNCTMTICFSLPSLCFRFEIQYSEDVW